MFEVTEGEQITDQAKLKRIFESYSKRGFITAIDDFGSGYAGLAWLTSLRPAVLKLDIGLIRDIDKDTAKQAVLKGILTVCCELKTRVLAEGVETKAELDYLAEAGIDWFQGYYFAKPQLEKLLSHSEIQVWR